MSAQFSNNEIFESPERLLLPVQSIHMFTLQLNGGRLKLTTERKVPLNFKVHLLQVLMKLFAR